MRRRRWVWLSADDRDRISWQDRAETFPKLADETAGNEAMAVSAHPSEDCCKIRQLISFLVTFAVVGFVCTTARPSHAGDDVFQQAINYVFTGRVDPQESPEIVDRNACTVVMRDPNFNRYIRYYLSRFKMDSARFSTIYSGPQPHYQMDVAGDDIVIEYLTPDKTTVVQGYKTAQISLPGTVDRTQKALAIIFRDHCKVEKPKTPF
jgi:hypothetical protein